MKTKRSILFVCVLAFCVFSATTVQCQTEDMHLAIAEIPFPPPFEINNIEIRSEFPNLGQTFVYYNFIVNATARDDINMSQFFFDIKDRNENKPFDIKGGEAGQIKFLGGPEVAHKSQTYIFDIEIKFEEEGNYELYFMQGLDKGYSGQGVIAIEGIRGVTLANMEIVSPIRYQELKMNRDFIEETKSQTDLARLLGHATIALVVVTAILVFFNILSIIQSKNNTQKVIDDNSKFRKIEFLDKRLEKLYTPLINNWNVIKTFSERDVNQSLKRVEEDKKSSHFYEIKRYTHLASNEIKPLLEEFFKICDHPESKDTEETIKLKEEIEKQLDEDAKNYRNRLIELRE